MKLPHSISEQVTQSLKEDIGSGDVTADLISLETQAEATIICREGAILSGIPWVNEVFAQLDSDVRLEWACQDGTAVKPNATLCTLSGSARSLLSGERVALNFLQTLSATATLTQQYVKKIEGTQARILDTRKTLPNMREAQKYAVVCGGGKNHRIGLYDMILIKENHIMAAGSIKAAIQAAKKIHPGMTVEVETETLDEFRQASHAGADIIMLDNYSLVDMQQAVHENDGGITLEASGGVNLDTVRAIAETGVDFISVGDITKNIDAIDLSMRFIHE